ncbi:MAG: cytochrome d ubiquinol oxidase subunit II [Trebonia sp.]|jgi:cytochrome d ubiquinol oxidase subunit II
MHLSDLWFIAIAVLWAGYFILEGFDFGVGILLPFLSRHGDDVDRRVMINTIGPVWDGNEVWLLTAGGATFAAFPAWYAAMFSAFYLPLLLVVVALIIRGVAFEYRGKRDHPRWRAGWDAAIFLGSLVPALLWGVAFGNVLRGLPLNAQQHFTGNFFTFLNPYALLGGVTFVALFTLHGALFLALKTGGELRVRAQRTAAAMGVVAIIAGAGFLAWTGASYRAGTTTGEGIASVILAALAAVALIAAAGANWVRREGLAFAANAVAIAAATATLFTALYPNVLPSTTSAAYSLTVANAASQANTLMIMTVVALIFLPLVLLYQGWSYWVFRKRVIGPPQPAPSVTPPPPPARPTAAQKAS